MTAQQMWERYCAQSNTDINTPYEAWAYGEAPDNLLALTVIGAKTATASAYELYVQDPDEPVPQVGDYSVILDSQDQAQCVIATTQTTVLPFEDVDVVHAASEGEGDRSLAYWRRVHEDFFTRELAAYNLSFTSQTPVLCERFHVVHSQYTVDQLTTEQAHEVCLWHYNDIYSIYDFPTWEECVNRGWTLTDERKRQNAYFSVSRDGHLFGFFHIMDRQDHIELGVGIRPEFCGQGNGRFFMELALAKIEQLHGKMPVQLEVRTFNKRAIRCYEKAGFRIVGEFLEEDSYIPGQMYRMIRNR